MCIRDSFLIIALAMAVLAGFVLYQVVFDNLDRRFNTQLVESGRLAAEWMVQEENTRLANLRILSRTQGVGEALRAGDAAALRELTLGYTIGSQEEAVEFVDTKGRLVLSMRHRPGSLHLEDYVFGSEGSVNYRQWPFVDKVLSGQADMLGNRFSGVARAPWGDFFYVSGPVYDRTGQLAGVLLVGQSISTLVHKLRLDIGSQFTIYDLDGRPIASTFTSLGMSPMEVAEVLQRQGKDSLRRDTVSSRSLTFSASDYGEILGPWTLRGRQDFGLIGTAIPKDFLVRTSTVIRVQLVVMVMLSLLLVLVLGGMVANRITRPLVDLVRASKEVAQGNLDVKVRCETNDEIADLTSHFNLMTASIQQSHRDLLRAYDLTLEGWVKATDLRDNETERHMRSVVDLTLRLASRMGYPDDELQTFYRGALLHDVGQIGVADAILRKPSPLTPEERREIQKHTQYAYEILSPIDFLGSAVLIPYHHHERWDGTGYPKGLKGEEIPESARIFAIVDVWDAMTSDRVYQTALSHEAVVRYILENRGRHFDPRVVDAFLAMIGKAPLLPAEDDHG